MKQELVVQPVRSTAAWTTSSSVAAVASVPSDGCAEGCLSRDSRAGFGVSRDSRAVFGTPESGVPIGASLWGQVYEPNVTKDL
jgi:hypothetical protein